MRAFTKRAEEAGGYGKMVGFALILVLAFIVAAVFVSPIAVIVEKNILGPIKEKLKLNDKLDQEKQIEDKRVVTELLTNAKDFYSSFIKAMNDCPANKNSFCECATLDFSKLNDYIIIITPPSRKITLLDKSYSPVQNPDSYGQIYFSIEKWVNSAYNTPTKAPSSTFQIIYLSKDGISSSTNEKETPTPMRRGSAYNRLIKINNQFLALTSLESEHPLDPSQMVKSAIINKCQSLSLEIPD
jgi:hypothetical protein